MNEHHYRCLQALQRCTFLPGSFDKRFARNLSALPADALLTSKQIMQIERMAYRYRAQLARLGYVTPDELLEPFFERRRQVATGRAVFGAAPGRAK